MKTKIEQKHLKLVQDYFAGETEVLLAYLFGSQATGKSGPTSDYDFGLLARSPSYELQARISHHLAQILKTNRVDVVLLNQTPLELAYAIITQGQLIYQCDLATKVETEAQILSRYGDYLPILRAQREDILRGGGRHEARVQRYRTAFRRTERTLESLRAAQKQKSG
jgi:predicted nucleotidyltransferase